MPSIRSEVNPAAVQALDDRTFLLRYERMFDNRGLRDPYRIAFVEEYHRRFGGEPTSSTTEKPV